MVLYALDFTNLTEHVTLENDVECYRGNLGNLLCKILSCDFNSVISEIANLIYSNVSSGTPLPVDRIDQLIFDSFAEEHLGAFKDTACISTLAKSIYSFDPRKHILVESFGKSPQALCTDHIYDCFKIFLGIQAYLDETIDSPSLANPVAFEQFAVGCLEMEVPKEICAESLGDVCFLSKLFPDCDIRSILKESIGDLWLSNGDHVYIQTEHLSELLLEGIYYIFFHHCTFKRCQNCGRLFIPLSRSDERYCNNPSPQDSEKTCKQYGSDRLWYERLKNDDAAKLARKVYSAKQMLVRRNPDIKEYARMFEHFKAERKKWESDVKLGIKKKDEYIRWLNEMKQKKTL